MGIGRKKGPGGGTSLNFAVKAYDSEAELLTATPKENTIGIVTETQISSWIFKANEPETLNAGMIWITVDISGEIEFNALKKNAIQICPVSVLQYIDNEWTSRIAKIYINGTWVDLSKPAVTLYDNGTHYVQFNATYDNSRNAAEKNGYLIVTPQAGSWGAWTTADPVDIKGYRKLTANVRRVAGTINTLWLGLVKDPTSTTPDAIIDFKTNEAYEGYCETLLQGLSGSYYVKMYMKFGSGNEGELQAKTIGLA